MQRTGNEVRAEQRRIAAWFDGVYRRRGLRYLRPERAYAVFLDLLDVRAGQSLLDVACGPGHLLAQAARRDLRVHGVDISPVAVAMAAQRLPGAAVSVANAERLPFAEETFDHLTCLGSLERVMNRRAALSEMTRVLRPEGRLCLMVRNATSLRWRLVQGLRRQNREGHQDADDLVTWETGITEAGLECIAVYPDQWPLMWRERMGHRLGITVEPRLRRSGMLPLRLANEFIFLLRRAAH
ncbi:MAG: class I SAM-dependent methyltransferase [Pseudomonadota bacterium]